MTSAILTAPLDVLKTRLQSDFYQGQLASARASRGLPPIHTLSLARSSLLHISETFQILFAVPRIEGWRALFKGLGPNLVGVVPARAINFYAYGNGKKFFAKELNNGKDASWVHLLAAANAGIITGTATCPVWVIKTRLQLDKSHAEKAGSVTARRYKNALDCTMQTFRHEGIRGLYRGLGASYLGVTESTLQWVLYEQMKLSLAAREERIQRSGRPKTGWDDFVDWFGMAGSAGAAKLFAAIITYPHEVRGLHDFEVTTRNEKPEANNCNLGRANASSPGTFGRREDEVHRHHPVRQTHLERRRHGGTVRRIGAAYAPRGA